MVLQFNYKSTVYQLLISLIVFLVSKLVLLFVLIDVDLIYVHLECWTRGDSAHYLDIAKKGYQYFPCAGKFGFPADAKEVCGNTGWFPAYPMLIRLLSYFLNDFVLSAVIISNLFYYFSLFLLLKISEKSSFSFNTFAYLFLGSFFFGFIYYHAVFPTSMIVFFSLFSIYCFSLNRTVLTGIGCMVVAFSYPSGFLLTIALVLALQFDGTISFKRKAWKSVFLILLGGLGVVLCFALFQFKFDDWQAFIKVQAKYNHELKNPIHNIYSYLIKFDGKSLVEKNVIIAQSFAVIIGYLSLTYFFFLNKMHENRLTLATFLTTSLFFLFPWLVGGELSIYRSEALLLPGILILKDMKTDYLTSILCLFLFIGIPMSYLFFKNSLI